MVEKVGTHAMAALEVRYELAATDVALGARCTLAKPLALPVHRIFVHLDVGFARRRVVTKVAKVLHLATVFVEVPLEMLQCNSSAAHRTRFFRRQTLTLHTLMHVKFVTFERSDAQKLAALVALHTLDRCGRIGNNGRCFRCRARRMRTRLVRLQRVGRLETQITMIAF